MSYFTKRYHPPGTAPGTLKRLGTGPATPVSIKLIDFTAAEFLEQEVADAESCLPYLKQSTVTWVHVQGDVSPETLKALGETFELHPLALEDVANTGQRPKTDVFESQLFVVLSHALIRGEHARSEQVSLFLGENYVISFHEGEGDPFELVRKRLRKNGARIRSRGADYLLYTLIDVIIDEGFPVIEWFGGVLEDLEQELLERPDEQTLHRLYDIKRQALFMRRMLWPQREVLNMVVREDGAFVTEDTKVYFRDCYDHTVQILDLLETYRDMTTSMLDLYLSSVSNRLNEVMRVLTVIATIFIPLTFIVGVYGMNFGANDKSPWAMPELRWYYGYPLLWLVMLAVAGWMLYYFKRKGWFSHIVSLKK